MKTRSFVVPIVLALSACAAPPESGSKSPARAEMSIPSPASAPEPAASSEPASAPRPQLDLCAAVKNVDPAARAALVDALSRIPVETWQGALTTLASCGGARGLAVALSVPRAEPSPLTEAIFTELRRLADPRVGDALQEYLATKPHVRFRTLAAFAMAEVGDLRAAPLLAARLPLDEQTLYPGRTDFESQLIRNNNERVVAARLVAELAAVHPEDWESLKTQTEESILSWLRGLPSPHANGMRALSALGSPEGRTLVRGWANPPAPLPVPGTQPPMPEEWVVAESALRYAGAFKDAASWPVLVKTLTRRDRKTDLTMEGLMHGELAILGMSVRAIGVGAAQGLSEWGDHRAFAPLLRFVEDPMENELSRVEACAALLWVAVPADAPRLGALLAKYGRPDPRDEFRRQCVLGALEQRPALADRRALLALIAPNTFPGTRHTVARILGRAGLDRTLEAALLSRAKDPAVRVDALLAVALGGSPASAAKAISLLESSPPEVAGELQDAWSRSFGFFSLEDVESGRLFRILDNADAMSRASQGGGPDGRWPRTLLERALGDVGDFDKGPHSLTRVRLRYALRQLAISPDVPRSARAIHFLGAMRERGTLLFLSEQTDAVGANAKAALAEMTSPPSR